MKLIENIKYYFLLKRSGFDTNLLTLGNKLFSGRDITIRPWSNSLRTFSFYVEGTEFVFEQQGKYWRLAGDGVGQKPEESDMNIFRPLSQ